MRVRTVIDHFNRYGDVGRFKSAADRTVYDAPKEVAERLIEMGLAEPTERSERTASVRRPKGKPPR